MRAEHSADRRAWVGVGQQRQQQLATAAVPKLVLDDYYMILGIQYTDTRPDLYINIPIN